MSELRANIGPGAFVDKAASFEGFERAIRRKLLRQNQSQDAIAPHPDGWCIAGHEQRDKSPAHSVAYSIQFDEVRRAA